MMAPGLLSPGGSLPDGLAKDALVAIHAEGKEHACGIGKMAESSADVKKAGKGVAVEVVCWIGCVSSLQAHNLHEALHHRLSSCQ
jgi:PUA domain protein